MPSDDDAITIAISYSDGKTYRNYGSNWLTWDRLPTELAWLRANADGGRTTTVLNVRSGWLYG